MRFKSKIEYYPLQISVIEVPMTHSQTDYEIILISRYATVRDLKKRI
jgi:hypothetical protein